MNIKSFVRLLNAFILIVFSSSTLSAQKPPWKGTIAKDGEVVVVRNPKEPLYNKPILTLKEDYAIGGPQAKGEYVIALPTSLAVDEKGYLFVLDFKESGIKVFDETGTYVRTIGRLGQGPGEIGAAWSISLPQGSSELALYDIRNRKLTFFSLEGKFLRSIPLRGMIAGIKTDSQGNAYVSATEFGPGQPMDTLKKMSADMSRVLAEISSRPEDDSHNPFAPREYWVVDARDRLIYGEGKTYEIRYHDPAGKLIRKVLRDGGPLKVTQKDIDEFADRKTPAGINPVYNYSSHHGAYRSFFVDDLGRLFVQTWERTPDNRQDIHEIFDAEGRFIGRVPLSRHADLINPKVRLIRSGKYYAIEPDAEGYEVVKRYSIVWEIK
ncbi:MAG: 6-bladed beta-propeller [Candidatus Aminicenantes bacterium]|nr:6-bladed beta-propeller [Candidatus Aminicenantes bacterium]